MSGKALIGCNRAAGLPSRDAVGEFLALDQTTARIPLSNKNLGIPIMMIFIVISKFVKGCKVEKEVFYFKSIKLYLVNRHYKKVGFSATQEQYLNIQKCYII